MVLVEWCEQGLFAGKSNKLLAVDASIVGGWMDEWTVVLAASFSVGG